MIKLYLHVGNTFFSTFLIFGDLKTFFKNGLFPIFEFQLWGGFPYRSRFETCNWYHSIDLVELSKKIYSCMGSKSTQMRKTTEKHQNQWNLLHITLSGGIGSSRGRWAGGWRRRLKWRSPLDSPSLKTPYSIFWIFLRRRKGCFGNCAVSTPLLAFFMFQPTHKVITLSILWLYHT